MTPPPPLSTLVTILSFHQHIGRCAFDEVNVRNHCLLGPKDSLMLVCPIAKDFGDGDISVTIEYGTRSFVTRRANRTWTPNPDFHCTEQFCAHYVDAKCAPHNEDVFCYTNLVGRHNQDDYLLSLGMMMNIKDTLEEQAKKDHFLGAFKCTLPNEVQMFLIRDEELMKKLSINPLLDNFGGPWFETSLNEDDLNDIKDGKIFIGCQGKDSPQSSTVFEFAKLVKDSDSGFLKTKPYVNQKWRSAIDNYNSASFPMRIF